MRAVAAEAGLSPGNAYYYFPSKQHLVQHFYADIQAEHRRRSSEVLSASTSLARRLAGVLHAGFDTMAPYHDFAASFIKVTIDPGSPLSPFSGESADSRAQSIALFRDVLHGSSTGMDERLREDLPELLWLAYLGLTLFWVYDTSHDQRRTHQLIGRRGAAPGAAAAADPRAGASRSHDGSAGARADGAAMILRLVVMLGMLVVLPLGLGLIPGLPTGLPRLWVAGAVPAAVALWLSQGPLAAGLCVPYELVAVGLALFGLRWWWRSPRGAADLAVLVALAAPTVAATALIAERAGRDLFGFPPSLLALTVAHFHFGGFAAALIAGLVCLSTDDGPLARAAALCVTHRRGGGLPRLLARRVGSFGRVMELAGTVVLTVGLWLVAWLTWRERRGADRLTRVLFLVAAVVPVATMALALSWALGRVSDLPHLSIDAMVASHGVANAVGFALCSVLAWRRKGMVHSG
jgi:AcrR family transcriptional regulator